MKIKKINKCIECKKIIDIRSIRCNPCLMSGKNNPMYNSMRFGKLNPFFGKKHTITTKKKLSIVHKYKKLSLMHIQNIRKSKLGKNPWKLMKNPAKTKLKISKTRILKKLSIGKNNPMFGKPSPHGKRIYYKGICFRSSWEASYAKYLTKKKIQWRYEFTRFDLGNSTYCPDFYLPQTDEYIEVKGWWRDCARKKFNKFKKKFPRIKIKILFKKELIKLGLKLNVKN